MNGKKNVLLLLLILACTYVTAQLRDADRYRIKEAMRISTHLGADLWNGFDDAPFSILYIMDEYEYLINESDEAESFETTEYDSLIGAYIHKRPQEMDKRFRATFPFNGVSTIVMGTPENTGLNTTAWIITMLHERFHQYQYSSPKYFLETAALNLSNGDESGMWQLNYPFPYKDANVNKVYMRYTLALYRAVNSIATDMWEINLSNYLEARQEFRSSISEDDYKYISFQWYQEGIARYTEYAFLELLGRWEPDEYIKQLTDYVPFSEYRSSFKKNHLDNILHMKLDINKRETVYDVGFAEALIIREVNPNWTKKYLVEKFDLAKLYE